MGSWLISWGNIAAIPLSPLLYGVIALLLVGATYAFLRERGGLMLLALASAFGTFSLQEHLQAQVSSFSALNTLSIQTASGSTVLSCAVPPTPTPTATPTATPTSAPTSTPTATPTSPPATPTSPPATPTETPTVVPTVDPGSAFSIPRVRAQDAPDNVIVVTNGTAATVLLTRVEAQNFTPTPNAGQCMQGQQLAAGASCNLPCPMPD